MNVIGEHVILLTLGVKKSSVLPTVGFQGDIECLKTKVNTIVLFVIIKFTQDPILNVIGEHVILLTLGVKKSSVLPTVGFQGDIECLKTKVNTIVLFVIIKFTQDPILKVIGEYFTLLTSGVKRSFALLTH